MEPESGQQATDLEDDSGRALHARLLQRDPTASSDLAEYYLAPLVAWLRQTFRDDDEAMLESIAIDLMLSLPEHPERYNPDKLSLSGYLRMAARGDVKNAQDAAHRRAARTAPLDVVELRPPGRNSAWTWASDPADAVIEALEREKVVALRDEFGERDWELVLLLVDGERRTEPFAVALGLQSRPQEEQVREVKRAKDRLKKRLQRLWRRTDGDG